MSPQWRSYTRKARRWVFPLRRSTTTHASYSDSDSDSDTWTYRSERNRDRHAHTRTVSISSALRLDTYIYSPIPGSSPDIVARAREKRAAAQAGPMGESLRARGFLPPLDAELALEEARGRLGRHIPAHHTDLEIFMAEEAEDRRQEDERRAAEAEAEASGVARPSRPASEMSVEDKGDVEMAGTRRGLLQRCRSLFGRGNPKEIAIQKTGTNKGRAFRRVFVLVLELTGELTA